MPRKVYTSPVTPCLNAIPWRDFLARPAFEPPQSEALETIGRGPILVTGAGGSIGSALALRVAGIGQPSLLLLDSAENHLYELQQALDTGHVLADRAAISFLGNANDRSYIQELFDAHRPRIVFHTAAYKHVPLLEAQPLAAIANNIFATETIASAASSCGARVVLLSTDKAVEPASVMGATKRVAEEIVLASGGIVLRLGNVLASSGSVSEAFARQIARGGPLTVTHPDAHRYFLTLDEAVNLLLHSSVHLGSSALLAPALPATHSIVNLARFMVSQLAPGCAIPIRFTGLRPGDKITETFWSGSDLASPAGVGNLLSIQTSLLAHVSLRSGLATLHRTVEERDLSGALVQLRTLVPDFQPGPDLLALARNSLQRAHA
jgi:FlaA1/EpsC-like NDP-sugar epimerase